MSYVNSGGAGTSRKIGFGSELPGALAPNRLRTQTKGCISTGSRGRVLALVRAGPLAPVCGTNRC
jgi:hypothetical protein